VKTTELWKTFCERYWFDSELQIGLDLSALPDLTPTLEGMNERWQQVFDEMEALESGAIANPDEERQVGHYWLRTPELAPTPHQRRQIEECLIQIERFANTVRNGHLAPSNARRFKRLLLVGVGGSSLGPQLMSQALPDPARSIPIHFLDNTDPDGFDQVFAELGADLNATLVIVISKSGGTVETRNAMLETRNYLESKGIDFGSQAVAITSEGSKLEEYARSAGMVETFPMWDWVGGRTSLLSAVGLVPAALQGVDVKELLHGAAKMDKLTRRRDPRQNPAALLAAVWYQMGNGRGERNLVMLPYKDRLSLLGRYLQQLIMESLGKRLNLKGEVVEQGLTVFGNKGSTDQHAFVQQLRDGRDDFVAHFVEVLKDRQGSSVEIEDNTTSGDYLAGFLHGTRQALKEANRPSLTLTLPELSEQCFGALVALFERAVGFYATLIGINAYHQPGVEAGKRAARRYIELQLSLQSLFKESPEEVFDIPTLTEALEEEVAPEMVFAIVEHLSANGRLTSTSGPPQERKYRFLSRRNGY
jgi:glucose-6-phosphate isomerase